MKYFIIFSLIIAVLMISLVGAIYTPPTYDNVTIVLDSSYSVPEYTNVTIVLGEAPAPPAECWTQTANVVYIPNGCVYELLNGEK